MNKFLVDTVDSKDKLIQYFRKGIKKDNELRIGVEHEKFLFNKSDLKRVDYNQIKKIFENLKNNGWEPEYEKDKIIGLKRENQKITTEPGFQYELSGAPFKNIHSVCSENSSHFNELKEARESALNKHEQYISEFFQHEYLIYRSRNSHELVDFLQQMDVVNDYMDQSQ